MQPNKSVSILLPEAQASLLRLGTRLRAARRARQIANEVTQGVRAWRLVFESMGADPALMRRVDACFQQQQKMITA